MSSGSLFIANTQFSIAANENQAQSLQQVHNASITITNPPTRDQILKKYIIINGTASVTGNSGIEKVEAYVNKLPFNGTGKYRLATPIAVGNWSRWSFPIKLNDTGSYIIKARVTDKAGEQNWADLTIDLPAHTYNKTVAFVEPTFTYAAYRNGSFYDFYEKYSFKDAWSANKTITSDLNLLKNRPIPHGPFPYFTHPQRLDIPYIDYFKVLLAACQRRCPVSDKSYR